MPPLTFTLIQTNLNWENRQANCEMLEQKINALSRRTEVIILPEMFTTGFTMKCEELAEKMDGETVEWMKKIAREKKVIVTGSIIIEEEKNYYNRLIWMLPNGDMGCYNKRHLFAYAKENEHYTAGTKRFITSVKGWKLNMLVCYDLRFPVWARQVSFPYGERQGEAEYDVLIYVANWPERRNIAWKTLLRARAIENQCYVIGVNRVGKDGADIYYSGDSMVIDPLGEVLYEKAHEEDIFTITLEKKHLNEVRNRFPFWKDADKFNITNE